MNYYLISPRVDGYSIKGFLNTMFDKHIVMMGWGTDKQLGAAFYNIKKGDFILVAQRVNWKFTYYFAGIVADDITFDVDGCQCKKLKHFVDLRNSDINYLENASFYEMQVIKALMSINPHNNSAVISNLNEIIQYQKHKEMIEQYLSLLNSNHNLILTGAPGTGKTYLAMEIAKAMGADWELVQFHPSYDYTDFVEGLRPIKEGKQLGFERMDGVFKRLCKKALGTTLDATSLFHITYNELVRELKTDESLRDKFNTKLRKIEIKDNRITFRSSDGRIANKEKHYAGESTLLKLYLKIAENILDFNDEKDITKDKCTELNGSKEVDTTAPLILKELFRRSKKQLAQINKKPKTVLIIDEINRGEISKIFGELFYSIDPAYRGEKGKVYTQYQNLIPEDDVFYKGFYVPENVYIIGTMNDIDRSVESMDFAFRRRFAFKEIKAEDNVGMLDELDKITEGWTEKAINRMKHLNATIEKVEGLSSAYHLGASYFLKLKNYKDAANPFGELWDNHIAGLLFEYLRGVPDAAKTIDDLKRAYDDESAEDNG